MALASFSQKRPLSRYQGRSKAGVGAKVVKLEEEGQGIKHGACLWLRQQMFSEGGIVPSHPRAGGSEFPVHLGNICGRMV